MFHVVKPNSAADELNNVDPDQTSEKWFLHLVCIEPECMWKFKGLCCSVVSGTSDQLDEQIHDTTAGETCFYITKGLSVIVQTPFTQGYPTVHFDITLSSKGHC